MMHNRPAMVEQLEHNEPPWIKIINIVNHFCTATIIGQIMPSVSSKTRTTHFIQCIEWRLSSSLEQITLANVGVCRDIICCIAKEVWTVRQVLIVTIAKVGTHIATVESSIATTKKTLSKVGAMPYFREISILMFLVCGFIKLNTFNEGNLVFVDGYVFWLPKHTFGLNPAKAALTRLRS